MNAQGWPIACCRSGNDRLDPKKDHIIRRLLTAFYHTAIIGKWHLLSDPTGFTYWNILPGQGRYIDPILRANGEKEKVYKGYSTDVITDLALKWLNERDKAKPFMLCVHFKAPHRPWDPAPRFIDKFKDIVFPEPATLFDDFKNRSQAAANATMRLGDDTTLRDLGAEPPPGLSKVELRRWAFQTYLRRYLSCVAAVDECQIDNDCGRSDAGGVCTIPSLVCPAVALLVSLGVLPLTT